MPKFNDVEKSPQKTRFDGAFLDEHDMPRDEASPRRCYYVVDNLKGRK